jgi:lysozyme family protein
MRETFPAYMPQLFKHEGGFSDHPRDPGSFNISCVSI